MCRTITRYHLSPTGKPRLNHAVTALPSFLVKLSGQAFWSSRLAIMARDKKKHRMLRCDAFISLFGWLSHQGTTGQHLDFPTSHYPYRQWLFRLKPEHNQYPQRRGPSWHFAQ